MIVGLCGFGLTGKDTAAGALIRLGYKRFAFADELKDELRLALRMTYDVELTDMTPSQKEWLRPLFVAHGEIRRAQDPDYWLKKVASQIKPEENAVITDVRYVNEADWIRERGGKVVRLIRPNHGAAHNTEWESIGRIVDKGSYDVIVLNSGSIDDLHRMLIGALNEQK